MSTIVYVITNTINGKRYVGITKQGIDQRWFRHINAAKSGRPTRMAAAIRKYGRDAFTMVCVAEYDARQDALDAEVKLIAETAPEYNVTSGGDGVQMPMSDATRAKIGAANRNRPSSFLGKKHSPEAVAKIRAAASWLKRRIPIECVEDDKSFDSIISAARHYGCSANGIRYGLSGRSRSGSVRGKTFRACG